MKKHTIHCPYCGSPALLRDASFVYGSRARDEKLYVCLHYPACNSYVGVHKGTMIPKGTLANQSLRKKRILAHQVFDQIWKQGIMTKQNAYQWIADKFSLDTTQAHIGYFNDYMCNRLIEEASKVLAYNHIPLRITG